MTLATPHCIRIGDMRHHSSSQILWRTGLVGLDLHCPISVQASCIDTVSATCCSGFHKPEPPRLQMRMKPPSRRRRLRGCLTCWRCISIRPTRRRYETRVRPTLNLAYPITVTTAQTLCAGGVSIKYEQAIDVSCCRMACNMRRCGTSGSLYQVVVYPQILPYCSHCRTTFGSGLFLSTFRCKTGISRRLENS